jgi:hypothetical protein
MLVFLSSLAFILSPFCYLLGTLMPVQGLLFPLLLLLFILSVSPVIGCFVLGGSGYWKLVRCFNYACLMVSL